MDPFTIYALASVAVPAIASMFGGGNDETDAANRQLGDLTKTLTDQSKESAQMGQDVLSPAADYLKAVTGGDRQALLQATMPERRRVIDQYASAKKAIAEFAPRSGSQAGSMIDLDARKAGDLAAVTAGARSQGVTLSTQLGTALRGQSMTAAGQASSNLGTSIQTLLAQAQQRGATTAALGESLGSILGNWYLSQSQKAA